MGAEEIIDLNFWCITFKSKVNGLSIRKLSHNRKYCGPLNRHGPNRIIQQKSWLRSPQYYILMYSNIIISIIKQMRYKKILIQGVP